MTTLWAKKTPLKRERDFQGFLDRGMIYNMWLAADPRYPCCGLPATCRKSRKSIYERASSTFPKFEKANSPSFFFHTRYSQAGLFPHTAKMLACMTWVAAFPRHSMHLLWVAVPRARLSGCGCVCEWASVCVQVYDNVTRNTRAFF